MAVAAPSLRWFRGFTDEAMFHLVDLEHAPHRPGTPMFHGCRPADLRLSACGRWYYPDEGLIEGFANEDGTPPGFYNCPKCVQIWRAQP